VAIQLVLIIFFVIVLFILFSIRKNMKGGNLATVISQKLIEQKIAIPKLQVLVYPILQFLDFTLPAYRV
jgi:hypothetical protein